MSRTTLSLGKNSRVLFISGSIGLGHVTRDLAIASQLRRQCPNLDLVWLAADPARRVLSDAGEPLLPESAKLASETDLVETLSRHFSLPLLNPMGWLGSKHGFRRLISFQRDLRHNVDLILEVARREAFDLIIADEAYELIADLMLHPKRKPCPLAFIFDCVGLEATSWNPLECLAVRIINARSPWLLRRFAKVCELGLLVFEPEDVADKPFGPFLPSRRAVAREFLQFAGYAMPFDPAEYQDRPSLRQRLGYRPGPLIVCAIGGTAIGAPLLDLCGHAYLLLKTQLPQLQMVAVCGPRLSPASLQLPDGMERRGYVPRLYEHLAACDLAIVQGGGTTTLELTALRRPFLYFPLQDHFEQRFHVAGRLARHGAGVQLEFRDTTPDRLAATVLAHLEQPVHYPRIASDGALRAAELLLALLRMNAGQHSSICGHA